MVEGEVMDFVRIVVVSVVAAVVFAGCAKLVTECETVRKCHTYGFYGVDNSVDNCQHINQYEFTNVDKPRKD